MNQIVGGAGVVGLIAVNGFQDGGGTFLIGMSSILGRRRGDQCQGMEHLRLGILGVGSGNLRHGVRIGPGPGLRRHVFRVLVVGRCRRDELLFPRGGAAHLARLRDFRLALAQFVGARRTPELVVVGEGNAPVSHGAVRIGRGHLTE